LRCDGAIRGHILLGDNLHHGKITFEAGTLDLARLFGDSTFSQQHQTMVFGQILKRLGDTMEDLDWVFGNDMGESADGLVQCGSEWLDCQTLECLHQRMSEAVKAIT